MGGGFEPFTTVMSVLFGLAGLVSLAMGIAYFRDRKGYTDQLARLRQDVEDAAPTDPQYNRARQVYAVGAAEAATHNVGPSEATHRDHGGADGGGDGSD